MKPWEPFEAWRGWMKCIVNSKGEACLQDKNSDFGLVITGNNPFVVDRDYFVEVSLKILKELREYKEA